MEKRLINFDWINPYKATGYFFEQYVRRNSDTKYIKTLT